MYQFICRWLRGFLMITASGRGRERFLDLCAGNGIGLWNVRPYGGKISFCASKKDYDKLLVYQKKSGVDMCVDNKRGLPFLFYRYKKRKCFAIGFLLFIALIYSFTLFIWDINISGESVYTEEQIKEDIINSYVKLGTLKGSIDCAELEKELREKYDKIAWISCEIKGTQLNVTLTETIEKDSVSISDTPCNIVAAKDGIITDIVTRSGTMILHEGDEVKKGDILITGVVNIYNDYDELIETTYLPADGDVYAAVEREYEDSFSITYYEKEYTGKDKTYYGIGIGGEYFEPVSPSGDAVSADVISEESRLKLFGDFYLPFYIKKTTVKPYTPKLETYTDSEAEKKARKRLDLYLDDLRKKGVEILENNVTIEVEDGECRVSGYIVTKELIGVPADITIIDQGDT